MEERVAGDLRGSSLTEVARRRIVFADCNARRVMHYSAYFRLFEIGRAELFRKLGHPFSKYVGQGHNVAVFEAECRYHQPAVYDDEVVIRAGAAEVGRVWLRVDYEIANAAGQVLASGFTSLAAVDDSGQVRRIPDEVRQALQGSGT